MYVVAKDVVKVQRMQRRQRRGVILSARTRTSSSCDVTRQSARLSPDLHQSQQTIRTLL